MTGRFLITGLPRSRTAWLSVVADMMPGATCEHEPLHWLPRWEDVGQIWERSTSRFAGVSDSGLAVHLAEVLARFAPRTVIVLRSISAVRGSLARIWMPPPPGLLELMQRVLDSVLLSTVPVMVVRYSDLADEKTVLDVLSYLMPGAELDRDRVHRMMRMNVQSDLAYTREIAANRIGDVVALMGQGTIDHMRDACLSS